MLSMETALDFGIITVDDAAGEKVRNGQSPKAANVVDIEGDFSSGERIFIKNQTGTLLAFGRACLPSGLIKTSGDEVLLDFDRVLA